jgi:hypothetical protein
MPEFDREDEELQRFLKVVFFYQIGILAAELSAIFWGSKIYGF